MNGTRRGWLVAVLAVAVVALVGSVVAVAAGLGRTTSSAATGPAGYVTGSGTGAGADGSAGPGSGSTGYGPGMMGGSGPGMMGPGTVMGAAGTWQGSGRFGLSGNGQPVTTMAVAKARAQAWYHTWHGTFTAMVGE